MTFGEGGGEIIEKQVCNLYSSLSFIVNEAANNADGRTWRDTSP